MEKASSKKDLNIFKLLRIARNKDTKEIADELLVTTAYINAIESGKKFPSKRLLRDYAKVLDVDEEILTSFNVESYENSKFENVLLQILRMICNE